MKSTFVLGMCLGVSLTLAAQANPPGSARIVEGYAKLPLAFEANQGQSDPQVKFLSRAAGYRLLLTSNEAVLALQEVSRQEPALPGAKAPSSPAKTSRQSKSAVLRMKLVGSNAKTEVTGQDELPGKSNYFIGNDPKKWHTNVRQFAKVRYENVYLGVDLVYYGHQRELEYDFVVQPGVNPEGIRLGIVGARRLRLEHGDLVMTSAAGDVHLRSPHIYQEVNGGRQEVRGSYVIRSKNEVGFDVASYDRRRALVIDPVLAYSTYLGGGNNEGGTAIAVDTGGNAYVIGPTNSSDFPVSTGAFQTSFGGAFGDGFVTKLNAAGSGVVYSTYLGGSHFDGGSGIAVDTSGNVYVTGLTSSPDFPITPGAFQTKFGGDLDVFVSKLDTTGSTLIYSTFLGGGNEDDGAGIAVDTSGNAYVVGTTTSNNFPTTPGAFQTTFGTGFWDAFVSKLNADGSALVYSTYLGGDNEDQGSGIAIDAAGNAYVSGYTLGNFPTTSGAFQTISAGALDSFASKLNADGSALVYSTYLGGSSLDVGLGIAVDATGSAYITGQTESADFPTTSGAFDTSFAGGARDGFVSKLNAAGSGVVYSTYLGSNGSSGIAVDTSGDAYITGLPDSTVGRLNAAGSAILRSPFTASGSAVAVDTAGNAFVTGGTFATDFPTTPGAFQTSLGGNLDAFVSKFSFGIGPPANIHQCKKGGWKLFTIPRRFKNQGDCVSFVNTGK